MNSDQIINCEVHNIPIEGLCGDENCNLNPIICNQCESSNCTKIEDHPLLTVKQYVEKFHNGVSGIFDLKKASELINNFRSLELKGMEKNLENFNIAVHSLIETKLTNFSTIFISKIEKFRRNITNKLEKIKNEYKEAEGRVDLNSFEIPENFTLEEIKKFFEKNLKNIKDMENMINLVKKYSDNEKLSMNQKDMETIIYSKNITELELLKTIKEKFDDILKEATNGLNNIINSISFQNRNSTIYLNETTKFTSDPTKLKFKQDLTDKCQKSYTIDSVFAAFITVEGESLVAWANTSFIIEVFSLEKNTVIKSFTGHTNHVYIVRHFVDRIEKKDYLLSTSYERNCKIWCLKTNTCLVTISNCHKANYLYSALIMFGQGNESNCVLTTVPNEYTKVWDLKDGTFIRNIGTITDYTYYINSWYDTNSKETYIINANAQDIKLYNYKTGNLYKTYKAQAQTWHMSAFIHVIEETAYLFETDGNGYIRIWDVHAGTIFKSMHIKSCSFRGLCLWNDKYLIVASSDKSFKIFDFLATELKESIPCHDNVLCTVEKLLDPILGEILLTTSIDGKLKLFTK